MALGVFTQNTEKNKKILKLTFSLLTFLKLNVQSYFLQECIPYDKHFATSTFLCCSVCK